MQITATIDMIYDSDNTYTEPMTVRVYDDYVEITLHNPERIVQVKLNEFKEVLRILGKD